MEGRHPDLVISAATQADCRLIARLMLERRADEPRFQKVARRGIQRLLYERWAAPRFLSQTADTFRADRAGEMVGYLILLYDHPSIVILDMSALEGFKKQGIEEQLLAQAEDIARDRQYPYLRAGLAPGDSFITNLFTQAGYRPLEFRRWEFSGTVTARQIPEGITMRSLVGRAAVERQAHYLKAELNGAPPDGRELIEAHYLPKRPSPAQVFELVHEGEPFGLLSVKRERGTYALSLSTMPEWWGEELEVALVAAFPATAARASEATVKVRLDSTAHATAAAEPFAALGLERTLVDPEIWFKTVEGSEEPS
jgi:GNAT superfamily N-acetyltransferase